MLDGAYSCLPAQLAPKFHAASPLEHEHVDELARTLQRRVTRYLQRCGRLLREHDVDHESTATLPALMRTFLALDLPEAAKSLIAGLQQPLLNIRGITLTKPERCHLTLKFLGEIDDQQVERFIASLSEIRQASFQLSLTKLGGFPDAAHPRVIWLGVSNTPALAVLAQAVDRATSTIALDKPFVPHLSVARIKGRGVKVDPGLLDGPALPCTFAVTEFVFYRSVLRSAEPKYESLRKFALVG